MGWDGMGGGTVLMPPLPSSRGNCLEYAAEQHEPVEFASSTESAMTSGELHCRHAGRRVEKVGAGCSGRAEMLDVMVEWEQMRA
jgi:hypothetical protein